MRLIFMVHVIQILASQGFLYEQSNDDDHHQQMKTKNRSTTTDDAELQTLQKLVEKISKRQT